MHTFRQRTLLEEISFHIITTFGLYSDVLIVSANSVTSHIVTRMHAFVTQTLASEIM